MGGLIYTIIFIGTEDELFFVSACTVFTVLPCWHKNVFGKVSDWPVSVPDLVPRVRWMFTVDNNNP